MVACIAAAWLNGSWQIYRFPNGDANLTSSHAALVRSLFALGGILLLYEYMGYSGIYVYPTHSCGFFFFFSASIHFLRRFSLFFHTCHPRLLYFSRNSAGRLTHTRALDKAYNMTMTTYSSIRQIVLPTHRTFKYYKDTGYLLGI